jgi:ferredoxin--NADP+ reductase
MNTYKVLSIDHLTENTFRLRTERPQVPIRAGQCFNLGLPGAGVNREYSMYSDAQAPYLEFLVKVVKDGCVTPALQQLNVGDVVEIHGPYGEFCLHDPSDKDRQYLFLASGTGIAPFHSFIKTYPEIRYTLLHGIRSPNEQYDAVDYTRETYIPCISRNESGQASQRLTDYLRNNPAGPDSIVYLCGNRSMIIDAFEILRVQGVPGDNLFTEVFF